MSGTVTSGFVDDELDKIGRGVYIDNISIAELGVRYIATLRTLQEHFSALDENLREKNYCVVCLSDLDEPRVVGRFSIIWDAYDFRSMRQKNEQDKKFIVIDKRIFND